MRLGFRAVLYCCTGLSGSVTRKSVGGQIRGAWVEDYGV